MVILFGYVWKKINWLLVPHYIPFLFSSLLFFFDNNNIIRASLELEQSVVANLKEQMKQAPLNEKVSCTLYFY